MQSSVVVVVFRLGFIEKHNRFGKVLLHSAHDSWGETYSVAELPLLMIFSEYFTSESDTGLRTPYSCIESSSSFCTFATGPSYTFLACMINAAMAMIMTPPNISTAQFICTPISSLHNTQADIGTHSRGCWIVANRPKAPEERPHAVQQCTAIDEWPILAKSSSSVSRCCIATEQLPSCRR